MSAPVRICEHELHGPEVSYSIDTLDALAALHPDTRFRFLMGADSVPDLHRWKEGERIVLEYDPVVVARPGSPGALAECRLSGEAVARLRGGWVELTLRPISATEIRELVAAGKSLNGLVPPVVADYIARHRLYRNTGGETSK